MAPRRRPTMICEAAAYMGGAALFDPLPEKVGDFSRAIRDVHALHVT
ncbi:hypothetical protein [Dyella jiangningensis]